MDKTERNVGQIANLPDKKFAFIQYFIYIKSFRKLRWAPDGLHL